MACRVTWLYGATVRNKTEIRITLHHFTVNVKEFMTD